MSRKLSEDFFEDGEEAKRLRECLEAALEIIEKEYREEMEFKDWLGTGSSMRMANKEQKDCLDSIDRRAAEIRAKAKGLAQGKGPKKVIEALLRNRDVDVEDGGAAIICHVEDTKDKNVDEGMFVRLHSWNEKRKHEEIKQYIGKKVRITIETID